VHVLLNAGESSAPVGRDAACSDDGGVPVRVPACSDDGGVPVSVPTCSDDGGVPVSVPTCGDDRSLSECKDFVNCDGVLVSKGGAMVVCVWLGAHVCGENSASVCAWIGALVCDYDGVPVYSAILRTVLRP
jgi:hypothetical protein